jgi:hypothetical protein|tara:strand:+ start:902 stop:1789 length:888 start_codon:yes stop_codon:yes gene_type:complete
MPLVGSGQISLGAIATEFGGDAPHALSEYYGKGNCPASGEIQLAADFYGTANTYDCQYLLVAGGGGASGPDSSSNGAGSGGAGGYRALTATLTPGSSGLTVTVGGGGPGGGDSWGYQPWNTPGQRFSSNGGDSSFNSTSASGGGANGLLTTGASGGSGGGGGYQSGISYTPTVNYSGGSGNAGGYSPAEGAPGGAGRNTYGWGGDGGDLPSSDRTWLNGTTYADGPSPSGSGGHGSANTGNGARGGRQQYHQGRNGGSGIVIIRYAGSQKGTGGTVTSSGGYTYHTFTSSGTYNP